MELFPMIKETALVLTGIATYYYFTQKPKVQGLRPYTWYEYFSDVKNVTANPMEVAVTLPKERGPIYWFNFIFVSMIGVTGKEAMEYVAEQERLGNIENAWPRSANVILGAKTIPVAKGDLHTRLRKLNMTSLRPGLLHSYIPKMEYLTRELMKQESKNFVPFEDISKQIVTSIVFECLFGVDHVLAPEFQKDLAIYNKRFDAFNDGLFSVPIYFPGFAYYRAYNARVAMNRDFLIPIAKKAHQKYVASGKQDEFKTALVALMETPLDDGTFLNESEIGEQAMVLYFAGHDTTAAFLTNIFKQLHDHPDVLEKARKEQMNLFPTDRPITSQDLNQMPYLEACIKECLRLEVIVPMAFKRAERDLRIKDIFIPQGTILALNFSGTHNDYNSETSLPHQFDPSRFLHSDDYFIPFGVGKHTCIGKNFFMIETKIILSLFLRHYEWKEVGKSYMSRFPMSVTKNLLLQFTEIHSNVL
jgi:cytochrome P450